VIIQDDKGTELRRFTDTLEPGLNYINYDLGIDDMSVPQFKYDLNVYGSKFELKQADNKKYYLVPGKYFVLVNVEGVGAGKRELVVKKSEG